MAILVLSEIHVLYQYTCDYENGYEIWVISILTSRATLVVIYWSFIRGSVAQDGNILTYHETIRDPSVI